MRRRDFIKVIASSAAACPFAALAQQPPKIFRIGITTIQQRTSPPYVAFDRRLRELGYIDGQNLAMEFLNPDTQAEGIAGSIKELIRRKVDVIIAPYESAVKSALVATDTVPIVMIAIDYDPLALGYIKSLARPAANVTGLFLQQIELAKKRVQILKDALSDLRAATMFWDSPSEDQWKATNEAAGAFGLKLAGVELREQPYDYEAALAQAPPDHRSVLIMPTSPVFYHDRARLADLALRHGIASIFVLREWVEAGGLLSYGASFPAMFRRAAEYADRIAKGAKAADLPVEQPTKFVGDQPKSTGIPPSPNVRTTCSGRGIVPFAKQPLAREGRMPVTIGRRELIAALSGAAAAWPIAAHAQQPAMPVIGVLHLGSPEANAGVMAAFRQGLGETGYVEGKNVAIEFRWAHNESDRLPQLATDLVRRQVAVIVTPGAMSAALAAKAATTTIPIVFNTGGDPVQSGLVASLNRPGGNVTGVSYMNSELGAKRLGLLHELVPRGARFAVLVDRNSPLTDTAVADVQAAAASLGRDIEVLAAATNSDIVPAFTSLVHKRADALLVNPGALLYDRRIQVLTLAARHTLPVIYPAREWAEAGGLMSYGSSFTDQHRQAGIYTGRVLKGEGTANLPILRATKFELVINLQTANALGIDIPATLLARADEVIE